MNSSRDNNKGKKSEPLLAPSVNRGNNHSNKSKSNPSNNEFKRSEEFAKKICEDLKDSNFEPKSTVNEIEEYICSSANTDQKPEQDNSYKEKINRLLYSVMTDSLFQTEIDEEIEEIMEGVCYNAVNLLNYSLANKDNISLETIKIVYKIYDHVHLVNAQISRIDEGINIRTKELDDRMSRFDEELKRANDDLGNKISNFKDEIKKASESVKSELTEELNGRMSRFDEELKNANDDLGNKISNFKDEIKKASESVKSELTEEIDNRIKNTEKEYVTILGIFAATVLAFVGTFTFSTAVLSNISETGVFKLSAIASLVGLSFFNIINILIRFLREINGRTNGTKTAIFTNIVFIICLIVFSALHFKYERSESISTDNNVSQNSEILTDETNLNNPTSKNPSTEEPSASLPTLSESPTPTEQ